MQVKRSDIILGVMLSVGVTIMVMLPRLSFGRGVEPLDEVAIKTLLMLLATWFGHMWILSVQRYRQLVPRVWVRNILSILVVTFIVYYALELFDGLTPAAQRGALFERIENRVDNWGFARVLLWNIIYHWILFSRQTLMEKKDAELKAARAERLAVEAKMVSFREQLSPHFMFNSLNTLSSIISEQSAQRFVEQLASVYRYLLDSREQNVVTLEREVAFVRAYWHILKERFDDAIELKLDFKSELSSAKIPPVALQTLVENAVKHNVATQNRPLKITIKEVDDKIVVCNNLQPKASPMDSTGVGLHNLSERYLMLFNREIEIIQTPQTFTVKLPML